MTNTIDGIYAGFMTGEEGNGFSMFSFLNGIISGADPMGVLFDGSYAVEADAYAVEVKVTVPAGGTVIQGASAGPSGLTYAVNFRLPLNFAGQDFSRIETPLGAVNLRLQKLRGVES